jgi:hypothetical protein
LTALTSEGYGAVRNRGPSSIPMLPGQPVSDGLKLSAETLVLGFEMVPSGCVGLTFDGLALFGCIGALLLQVGALCLLHGALLGDISLLLTS